MNYYRNVRYGSRGSESDNESGFDSSVGCGIYSFLTEAVSNGSVCIVGSVCNIITFIVCQADQHKTATSFLLQYQSVIDSFLMIFTFIRYSIPSFVNFTGKLQGYNSVHPYVLAYVYPCAATVHTASVWNTVLVGVNRYIVVVSPYIVNQPQMRRNIYKYFVGVIIGAACYNIPRFFATQVKWIINADNVTFTNYADNTEMGSHYVYSTVYEHLLYSVLMVGIPIIRWGAGLA